MRSTALAITAALALGACTEPTSPTPATLLSATMSPAEPETFVATLSGDEEVPVRPTHAAGAALFKVRPAGTEVAFTLIVANIDNAVAAHIHCGPAGVNGGVVVGLFSGTAGGGQTQGIIGNGSFDGSAFTCAGMSLLDAMRAGQTYVNVHTNDGIAPTNTGPGDFPGGEIRGQVRAAGQ
jgi:hypothetical protein